MERLERRTDVLTTNDAPGAEPPDLTDLVGFSRADLLQNRADQLSQDQAAELTESLQGRAIGGAVLLALAGLFVYLHGLTLVNLLWLIGLGFYLYGMVDRYRELRAGVVDRVGQEHTGDRNHQSSGQLGPRHSSKGEVRSCAGGRLRRSRGGSRRPRIDVARAAAWRASEPGPGRFEARQSTDERHRLDGQ